MGKVTGFLEFQRLQEAAEPIDTRVHHYREFVMHLDTLIGALAARTE